MALEINQSKYRLNYLVIMKSLLTQSLQAIIEDNVSD